MLGAEIRHAAAAFRGASSSMCRVEFVMSHPPAQLRDPSRKYAVSLIEAGFCQCRFIISEDAQGAICCGAPTAGGSWCDWHRSIVYEAARERAKPRSGSAPGQAA